RAYGPRLWRGSAAGAVNVRGYLSTGAQRPFPLRIGPRGMGEAKTRDRRASWSVKIPAMAPSRRRAGRSSLGPARVAACSRFAARAVRVDARRAASEVQGRGEEGAARL